MLFTFTTRDRGFIPINNQLYICVLRVITSFTVIFLFVAYVRLCDTYNVGKRHCDFPPFWSGSLQVESKCARKRTFVLACRRHIPNEQIQSIKHFKTKSNIQKAHEKDKGVLGLCVVRLWWSSSLRCRSSRLAKGKVWKFYFKMTIHCASTKYTQDLSFSWAMVMVVVMVVRANKGKLFH